MTVCNMSIEAGARAGMIAPDETTYAYMQGRPYAPTGRAVGRGARILAKRCRPMPERRSTARWRSTRPRVAPMVTWGTNPEQALPVTGAVPDPRRTRSDERRTEYRARRSTTWGSQPACRSRTSRSTAFSSARAPTAASRICARRPQSRRLGKAVVPAWVVPGSGTVKRAGRRGRARPHFHRGGIRVARTGLLAVHGDQRRSVAARRALRIDLEPQFPRPPGHRRPHASRESGDGGGRGDEAAVSPTCANCMREADHATITTHRHRRPHRRAEHRHQPAVPDALQQGAARPGVRATSCSTTAASTPTAPRRSTS